MALDAAWKVTSLHNGKIRVQHNGGEGVVVSFIGGSK
jgi:hypothetical protein